MCVRAPLLCACVREWDAVELQLAHESRTSNESRAHPITLCPSPRRRQLRVPPRSLVSVGVGWGITKFLIIVDCEFMQATHTRAHTCTHTRTRMHTCTYTHTLMCTRTHTHTHTHTHTCRSNYVWLLVIGSFTSFGASWGIGANDVANSFATSEWLWLSRATLDSCTSFLACMCSPSLNPFT